MEDEDILALFWDRDQRALALVQEKFGGYCASIAGNILESDEDARECVNDTWLRAWASIPPHRPENLAAYLGKITRNLALNRWEKNRTAKRGGGQTAAVLEELAELLSDGSDVFQELERRELIRDINAFLGGLKPEHRSIFLCRYWYLDSREDIAARFGKSEGSVDVTLHRIRKKLGKYLKERGYDL